MTKVAKIEQKDRFIELRAKGLSCDELAKELGVSKPTLIKLGKELELEISNRKALELQMLQEKYYVSKAKRIELFGEELLRLREELGKRDLTEIPTEKLYDLTMKMITNLKQEEIEIRLKERGTLDDTLASINDVIVEWRA